VKYQAHPSPHYYRCRVALVAAVLLSVLSPVVVVVVAVVVQGGGLSVLSVS
jgi:uncharacterized membrane protein